MKIFKKTLSFWPSILDNIHIYIFKNSKNKHNFHLNKRIILKIQTILQKKLQIVDIVSDYW